ncbi:MAG: uncharacterized protein PWQ91_1569 [Eubacteriales bacterium]|nr:uncharacterized protein [Eubacteriales bacterium]
MYFTEKGPANTDRTISLALKRAEELDIRHIVVASSSGETARKLVGSGFNIVCVTHHVGFAGPGQDEMSPEVRQELINAGVKVLTTTHLFAGVDRALRLKFGGVYPAEIIAQTLRLFGQGVKVAVEIAVMALDAGLIPYGEEVIAIGGTGEGADSAIVVQPEHSHHFFNTRIKEIICKPREI